MTVHHKGPRCQPNKRPGEIMTNTDSLMQLAEPCGIRIIESDLLVIGPFEDWSQVRSPGRAARRRKKHRQRIRFYHKPDPNVFHDRVNNVIYAHPITARQLRASIQENNQ